ncbi:drp35 [Acrasis kona]|uniref:Drp35 n=1 Tax=Acrasis kona TaxID=1008807 RepID=A0AAW2ZA79_9EUKA
MRHIQPSNQVDVQIESSETNIDFHIVDPVVVTQDEQQLKGKDFAFVDIRPYSLNPLADSVFIELVETRTITIAVREVIGRKENSNIIRVTKGVLKKYHRRTLMLHINGKQLLAQSRLRGFMKS